MSFASFLDVFLSSSDQEYEDVNLDGIKRRRVEGDPKGSTRQLTRRSLETSVEEDTCVHPGFIREMCVVCGRKMGCDTPLAGYQSFKYIYKDFILAKDEIARLRNKDLLPEKKLYLVLDLDHTLLNSTLLRDLTPDEEYLKSKIDSTQDISRGHLFRLDFINMLTKFRPFVRTFLEEASKLFEMYIYTMGERHYALEMAKLLDPEEQYFTSKVIAREDCTQIDQKGLDVIMGKESAVLILDDTKHVWEKHKENLILMERYNFFASSCQQFGSNCKSYSELKSDETDTDGPLASTLDFLKQIHNRFFDSKPGANLADRDVREVLKNYQKSRWTKLMRPRNRFSRGY